MKRFLMTLLVFIPTASVLSEEGPELFVSKKCVKCHTVSSYEIETTSKKDPSEISDLSNSGSFFDAETLKAYLNKETERNGEKHKLKIKGEDSEIEALINWLLTLKQPAQE